MYRWSGDGRALSSVFYIFVCIKSVSSASVYVCARGCMFTLAVSSGLLLCAPVNTCTGLYKRACIGAAFKTKTLGCKGK